MRRAQSVRLENAILQGLSLQPRVGKRAEERLGGGALHRQTVRVFRLLRDAQEMWFAVMREREPLAQTASSELRGIKWKCKYVV